MKANKNICPKCSLDLKRQSGKTYWIEYYVDGQRRRERVGPSKELAQTVLRKRIVERAEGRLLDKKKASTLRFEDLTKWYLGLAEVKAKRSFGRDERSVKLLLKKFFGKPVSSITCAMVEAYRQERLAERSYTGHLIRPATVNREIACLKTMFNKALKDGKVEKNPCFGVKLLKENNVRERLLSRDEYDRLLAEAASHLTPILITAYHTAMRAGEILELRWSSVDLKGGFIRLEPEDTKTNEARSIPLSPEVVAVLQQQVRCVHHDFVFTRDGAPITSIRKAFVLACERAKVEDFHFHDFRHTCINNWRLAGHDYFRIMAASGHKTMSVFKRYNKVTEEELQALVRPSVSKAG